MALTLDQLTELLEASGARQYGGEAVSQLDHALQCAFLAEQAGEPDELVVACLLHDVGHLVAPRAQGECEPGADKDDVHQYLAIPFLRGVFPDGVLEPIRLHVDAKRYLCQAEPGYWDSLSPVSKRSLELQGGVFDAHQAAAFIVQPFAPEAVRLRRYDDLAKTPGLDVPDLDYYTSHMQWVSL